MTAKRPIAAILESKFLSKTLTSTLQAIHCRDPGTHRRYTYSGHTSQVGCLFLRLVRERRTLDILISASSDEKSVMKKFSAILCPNSKTSLK